MSFARVARVAGHKAGRRAMSIGNQAARPYQTPTLPSGQFEALQRNGLKFGAWGTPVSLAAVWLFWTRKDEIIYEVKSILGTLEEE